MWSRSVRKGGSPGDSRALTAGLCVLHCSSKLLIQYIKRYHTHIHTLTHSLTLIPGHTGTHSHLTGF
ncbi:hypothetical protein SKAU_G00406500 [Synaphobranchus kaupii]|uniref:Uncharacterized protein n=1 Tax=Synaphobranchus kaupii TaxID=118154 RepID=A0A9Q1ICX0_SYNKA|nr:hypothetical protein SKAU_G00406500 [Synaphobranchus kaupii]